MSTITPELEAKINSRVDSLITAALKKSGLTREQLPQSAVNDAQRTATAQVEREVAEQENPYFREAQELREKNRLLEMQLSASRDSRPASPQGPGTNVNLTIDRAVAKVGLVNWRVMTDAQRLACVGVNPNEVDAATKTEICALFGSQSDSARAADLMKVDRAKYQRLKLIGRVLNMI